MSDKPSFPVFDPFGFMKGFAPQNLSQDILRGWSLISITENNSSAPDTEKRIVEHESYGRQIGKIMQAVNTLIDDLPEARQNQPAFVELKALSARIETLKTETSAKRIERLKADLAQLKLNDPDEYERQTSALKTLLMTP
jgi:hypothetical protein